MRREVRHARWSARWVAVAVCTLTACNGAPETTGPSANAGASSRSVVEEVRLATDRSTAQSEVVTLPNGERMKRVRLGNGFSHVMIGKVGPDGKPSVSCVDRPAAAESFLAGSKQGGGQ